MRNRTKKRQPGRAYDLLGLVGAAAVFLSFLVMMALR
jgi:hypothetical protein